MPQPAYKRIITLLAILLATGCANTPETSLSHEMLNAALWQQTSGEYQALARQTYSLATLRLDEALSDPDWTAALEQSGSVGALPPAIVVDIDETVLDNSFYETKIIRELGQYSSDSFAEWCRNSNAPPVPGASEFLLYAVEHGVTVFYYSARREHLRACTTRNLTEVGFPLQGPGQLLLNSGNSKSAHRARIANGYRILLLVGDNLEDFVEGSKSSPADRLELAKQYTDYWGRKWIVLPNPIYGHWESTAYDFDYSLPRGQQLRKKNRLLEQSRKDHLIIRH